MAWRTAQGCLGLWRPAPGVLVAALHGHGDALFASRVLGAYEELEAESFELYFDLQGLRTYESLLPARIAARMLPDRRRVSSAILLETPQSTMGFGVIGVMLGDRFEVHTSRADFETALNRALAERRVVGFSLTALNALVNHD